MLSFHPLAVIVFTLLFMYLIGHETYEAFKAARDRRYEALAQHSFWLIVTAMIMALVDIISD